MTRRSMKRTAGAFRSTAQIHRDCGNSRRSGLKPLMAGTLKYRSPRYCVALWIGMRRTALEILQDRVRTCRLERSIPAARRVEQHEGAARITQSNPSSSAA